MTDKEIVQLVLSAVKAEKAAEANKVQEVEKLISIPKFCSLTGASQDFIREKCWCTDPKLHPFPCIKRTGKTGQVTIKLYLSLGLKWLEDEMTGAWKERA